MITILFLGDVVGRVGRQALKKRLSSLKKEHGVDLAIVNGENSAGGIGIDPGCAEEIFVAGADVITTGNHIWSKREIEGYLNANTHRIIRPANYAEGAPGAGYVVWKASNGVEVGVVNISGRVFMGDLVDCPFKKADEIFSTSLAEVKVKFVDFHAEATSEKVAMAHYLDGRASVVVGTHTHVQTADERILQGGSACITDVGMCGPRDSVIGMQKELVLQRFVTGRPIRFDVAKGEAQINGVLVKVDVSTGKAISIERVFEVLEAA